MKKRLLSLFLVFVTLLGILPTAALAANTEEEALGEVDIYNGGYELSYLTINGRIRTQDYTYFNYVDAKGQKKEVPAYCVNPNIKGVPQTVGVGESIQYLANERSSDPKGGRHHLQRLPPPQFGGIEAGQQVPSLLCHQNGAVVLPAP